MPAVSDNLVEKVKAALAADPKRTWLLAGLSIVLIGLWLHAVRGGPAVAGAAFLHQPSTVDAQASANLVPNRSASSNALIDWLGQPKPAIGRNLFAMRTEFYTRGTLKPGMAGNSDYSDETAKSESGQADQTTERQTAIQSYRAAAAKLSLQSTVLGPMPTAMVNGQLVREGDSVESFQVVKIEARRIIVQQDGVTLQINMD